MTYAQFGEDVALLEFFGEAHRGYFVDAGANDGIRDSNTALLEEHGWSGILIDANPAVVPLARARRTARVVHRAIAAERQATPCRFFCVSGGPENLNGLSTASPTDRFRDLVRLYGGVVSEVQVPGATLAEILDEANAPAAIDVLSIDLEGGEEAAIRGCDFTRYAPRIILVEDNSRGEDRRVARLLARHGYRRAHRTGVNDWYVRGADLRRFLWQRVLMNMRLWKWATSRRLRARRPVASARR